MSITEPHRTISGKWYGYVKKQRNPRCLPRVNPSHYNGVGVYHLRKEVEIDSNGSTQHGFSLPHGWRLQANLQQCEVW